MKQKIQPGYQKQEAQQSHQPTTIAFLNGARLYCKALKDPKSVARGANINHLWWYVDDIIDSESVEIIEGEYHENPTSL